MSPDLGTQWRFQYQRLGEPEPLGHFSDTVIGWWRKARPLHPLFLEANFLAGATEESFTRLAPDLSNLRDWVQRYGWDRLADPRVFSEIDERGWPTNTATSRVGYNVFLRTPFPSPKLSVRCFATPGSSLGNRGHGTIELPRVAADPSLLDPALLTALTRVTVDHQSPDSCCVFSLDFDRAVGNRFTPGQHSKDFLRIGWITYFGNPAVREVLPADIHAEPFGPGLLVMTQPGVPDLSRPEDVERGRGLVTSLRETGWLKLSRMKRSSATQR